MQIAAITNATQLVAAEAEIERFRSAAAYVRSNPAPPDIMPYLWLAQAEACEEIAKEFEEAVAAYRERQARREYHQALGGSKETADAIEKVERGE